MKHGRSSWARLCRMRAALASGVMLMLASTAARAGDAPPWEDRPYLGSGPLLRLGTGPREMDGHLGVTAQALQRVTTVYPPEDPRFDPQRVVSRGVYPRELRQLIQEASQDPDFYAWSIPAAHAQTPCDEAGTGAAINPCGPGVDVADCSRREFLEWIREQARRTRAACERKDGRAALYWVGFTLHAVQDLASHRGRTNAEHAHASYVLVDADPDEAPSSQALALDMSERFLASVGERLGEMCAEAINQSRGDGAPQPASWKTRTAGLEWDFTPANLLQYRQAASRYAELVAREAEAPIRWMSDPPGPEAGDVSVRCASLAGCEAVFGEVLRRFHEELSPP